MHLFVHWQGEARALASVKDFMLGETLPRMVLTFKVGCTHFNMADGGAVYSGFWNLTWQTRLSEDKGVDLLLAASCGATPCNLGTCF